MSEQKPVRIKKVTPYPFPVDLVKLDPSPPIRGEIVKIVEVGFLAKVKAPIFKVGENWNATFEIPASHALLKAAVKVMKTYDAHEKFEEKSSVKSYLVEFQFLQMGEEGKVAIGQFCRAIGQTSK